MVGLWPEFSWQFRKHLFWSCASCGQHVLFPRGKLKCFSVCKLQFKLVFWNKRKSCCCSPSSQSVNRHICEQLFVGSKENWALNGWQKWRHKRKMQFQKANWETLKLSSWQKRYQIETKDALTLLKVETKFCNSKFLSFSPPTSKTLWWFMTIITASSLLILSTPSILISIPMNSQTLIIQNALNLKNVVDKLIQLPDEKNSQCISAISRSQHHKWQRNCQQESFCKQKDKNFEKINQHFMF